MSRKAPFIPNIYLNILKENNIDTPRFLSNNSTSDEYQIVDIRFAYELAQAIEKVPSDKIPNVINDCLNAYRNHYSKYFIWLLSSKTAPDLLKKIERTDTLGIFKIGITDENTINLSFDIKLPISRLLAATIMIGLIRSTQDNIETTLEINTNETPELELESLINCTVIQVHSSTCSITFSKENITTNDLTTHNNLIEQISSTASYNKEYELQDFISIVQSAIRKEISKPNLSISDIAKTLYLSTRTLQRQLKDEKESFQSLLNNERRLYAQELIRTGEKDKYVIAEKVGYQDLRSLYRLLSDSDKDLLN